MASEASLQARVAPSLVTKMEARDILYIYYHTYVKVKGQCDCACAELLGNQCNLYNLPIENQLSYLPVLHWIHGLGELVAN